MIVVEHAGIKISYSVSSSKSLVDYEKVLAEWSSQSTHQEGTNYKKVVSSIFAFNQQHETPYPLTYPYLPNLWLIKEEL
jgi:hypothetical protein